VSYFGNQILTNDDRCVNERIVKNPIVVYLSRNSYLILFRSRYKTSQ